MKQSVDSTDKKESNWQYVLRRAATTLTAGILVSQSLIPVFQLPIFSAHQGGSLIQPAFAGGLLQSLPDAEERTITLFEQSTPSVRAFNLFQHVISIQSFYMSWTFG